MHLRVSHPDHELKQTDMEAIQRDLEKIDRRLGDQKEVYAELRVNESGAAGFGVTLEVEYGRTHLLAKERASDLGQAVRAAREDILRQINDRSRRGHSSFAKGR